MPLHPWDAVALGGKTKKNKIPLWQEPLLGKTAELPLGNETGSRLEHTQNHLINYRLSGPAHWSPLPMVCGSTAVAAHDGILYIPIHMPPTKTGDSRKLALHVLTMGPTALAGTESHIKYREATFGSGAWTTLWSDTFATAWTALHHQKYVLTYTPPASTGASSVKCIEVKFQNMDVRAVAAWHMPLMHCDDDQYFNAPGDCGPGKFISDEAHSFKGLVDAVGTGAADVESMERITRRTFFNQSHIFGSYISSTEGLGHTNMLHDMEFSARCRNLKSDNASVNCVPCAVILCTGQDASASIDVQFKSTASAATWTYTVQAGDDKVNPIFIHPWRTGSSSSNGLAVYSNADDAIQINVHATTAGGPAGTCTLYSWALFEGPAWS